MAYYVELTGGDIQAVSVLNGGDTQIAAELSGGDVYPSGGGSATLQTKSVSITPTESTQTQQITPDPGFDGLSEVDITTDAIPANYVGSGVPRKTSADLTASGDTVTAPAGYYENPASKAVAAGSATTPATTITANPTLSVSASGLITANVSKTQNITPTVTPGYVNAGTAGTVNVSGTKTQQLATQAAATYHPATTDQTIAAAQYLTGAQTIKAVQTTNLAAENIKKDVVVQIGDADDPDSVANIIGTYEGGGGGYDFWNKAYPTGAQTTTRTSINAYVAYGRTGITSLSAPNATSIADYALYGCTGLTSVSLPVCTSTGAQSMRGCTNLLSVSLPALQIIGGSTGSTSKTHLLSGCTKLTDVWMPKVYYFQGYEFAGCSALTGLDFPLLKTIKGNAFQNCTNLTVLILRRSEAATVSNISSFSGTPFASSGTGGTLYVPQSLISTYQGASVWSTLLGYANNQIKAIEGSAYENYYYNGSPVT